MAPEMLEIDGSLKSGSGTMLRLSVAFSAITGRPLHMTNIRARRSNPGLRPQHLEAVLTAAKLCRARVSGARVGSMEITFEPSRIVGGRFRAEIGTAGSIPMLIMTILPICIFAPEPVRVLIEKGGTDVRHAPTINYMRYVLLPVLAKMGVRARIRVLRYGYYPRGLGAVELSVEPLEGPLQPIVLEEFGELQAVRGVSVCTFLEKRKVADRQARAAREVLAQEGLKADIRVVYDRSNPAQRGSSIVLWAETDTGVLLGADSIGELGKPAEVVGREAAEGLLAELRARATADVHLADMLVPYVALADGRSAYLARELTDHMDANIWLAERILGARFHVQKADGLYRVECEGSPPSGP